MRAKPICYDLYCGLGGWTEAFLEEGYCCIGFDIEAHDYGTGGYPGELRLRDVRSIHGSELRDAAVIVGSSPCQEFSYRAMPWKRAKALPPPYLGMELFNAQFRIQREACEAAGRHIPMVVENVRGAQKWVGRARWNYGSFYLWGDVPALMPLTFKGFKSSGMNWSDQTKRGQDFTRIAGAQALEEIGRKVSMNFHEHAKTGKPAAVEDTFGWRGSIMRKGTSHGKARKAASAMIAKIPRPLALHIAHTYKPAELEATA